MSKTIQPVQLDSEIAALLEDYTDEVNEAVNQAIEETSKESQKRLRNFKQGRNPWNKYPKGWSIKVEKGALSTEAVIYNKDHYQLVHLLEFGHATRNGGRTAAFPHVADVNDFAQETLQRKIEEKLT